MDDALVSVVIPVYNGERFLGRTLASALAQTYSPIEFLIVDDSSTDRTAMIAEAAAASDSRIRYFRRPKSGTAASRNFGISQARGDLIAPLDADDLWHPTKISRQVEVMNASSPEVGLVYCWSIEIDENDFIIPSLSSLKRMKKSTAQGRVTAELARGCFIEAGSMPLMKRSKLLAIGGYDVDLQPQGADDWKLYLTLSEICDFAVVPKYLVGYRQVTGSVSRNLTGMSQSQDNVIRWLFERRPDFSDELKRHAAYHVSVFMAHRAIDNSQFGAALGYVGKACKTHPKGLLDPATFRFGTRFLARVAGLGRSKLRQRGLMRQISFNELQCEWPAQIDS